MATSDRSLWPRIILMGDSITQMSFGYDGGWGGILEDALERRCDVSSRGFGGYNTRHWRTICREVTPKSLEGELGILFLGANDSAETTPNQYVPLEEYKTNIADVVTYIKDQIGVPEFLLITPPPLDEDHWHQFVTGDGRTSELTAQYAAACVEEAAALGVSVLDIHTSFLTQTNWKDMLSDGLHLSRTGSEYMASLLVPAVKTIIAPYLPSNMTADEEILPSYELLTNEYPCPEIVQWIQDHPVISRNKKSKL